MDEQSTEKDRDQGIRFLSNSGDDYRIRAHAPVGDSGTKQLTIFRRDQINYIFEHTQPGVSCIRLHGGLTVYVRMELPMLDNVINSPDFKNGSLIDLASATAAVKIVVVRPDKIGDRVADGTIYLGCHGNKDWFVAAECVKASDGRSSLMMSFNDAAAYAKNLMAHGHEDWRLPPGYGDRDEPDILNEMFKNRDVGAFKETYNKSSGYPASSYWSSTSPLSGPEGVWQQNFKSGEYEWDRKFTAVAVRCVRAVPRL